MVVLLTPALTPVFAQQGWWRTELQRADGHAIVFNFEWKLENGKNAWYIRNAGERIAVKNITRKGDSLIVEMPVFESQFRLTYSKDLLQGVWIKGGAVRTQIMPFVARPGRERFAPGTASSANIGGRWATTFINPGKPSEEAVAELLQKGNILTGTVLTPTGDYRYLEGVVRNDSMLLSCFDGGHAYLFMAAIKDAKTLTGGWFFSGAVGKEEWTAVKNDKATIDLSSSAMYLKPGQESLHFSFKDIDGKTVSIKDERFKNKVVVVQIMGSWCPNCMDETAFLSDYYAKNRQRGVEIVALAYEYSTDRERSVKSLQKFRDRFKVEYPLLITGVSVTDTLRTEKTLPEVTRIKTFPSSIFIDKKGRVRKFDYGFNGPATGEHYTAYKKEFEEEINALLKE
ncbi:MAG: TlpA family protein disulfide reductase [Bacteroidetes bacterium]|nr:TlpA family protein disulfide reductase [Bacteroidota bacterium]